MLNRDVSRSPFKNPSLLENPSPSQYVSRQHEMAREFSPRNKKAAHSFQNQGSNPDLLETIQEMNGGATKPLPSYQSITGREFLDSVSKEIR